MATTTADAGGRPARKKVEVIRTKVWVRRLMQVSGLRTGYALECSLQPELVVRGDDGIKRPKKWDGYVKGTRSPVGRAGAVAATEIAESRFPGTRAIFDSPAWRYLDGASLTAREIEAGIHALGLRVANIALGTPEERVRMPAEFTPQRASELAGAGTIEALLACVLLVAKSDVVASPSLRGSALRAISMLQTLLRDHEQFADVMPELAMAIDLRCKHLVHLNNQTRLDIVIFSDEVRRLAEDDVRRLALQEGSSKTPADPTDIPSYFDEADKP